MKEWTVAKACSEHAGSCYPLWGAGIPFLSPGFLGLISNMQIQTVHVVNMWVKALWLRCTGRSY